jgi:hypothetical protein
MAQVILDFGGCGVQNLSVECIGWHEEQTCKPAVRDVPTRTAGAHVDTGTFKLKARVLTIIVRLSDAQKTSLQTLFDNNSGITILAEMDWDGDNEWYYYDAWFTKKPVIYEYKSRGGSDLREWIAELEFKVGSFEYT